MLHSYDKETALPPKESVEDRLLNTTTAYILTMEKKLDFPFSPSLSVFVIPSEPRKFAQIGATTSKPSIRHYPFQIYFQCQRVLLVGLMAWMYKIQRIMTWMRKLQTQVAQLN